MPPSSCRCPVLRPSAEVNRAIRMLSAGRDTAADWDGEALAELDALRAEWQAAVAVEAGRAA